MVELKTERAAETRGEEAADLAPLATDILSIKNKGEKKISP